jgi:hypothetical protein
MSNLNEQQFAQYSAIQVPHPYLEYEYKPLPASMERHAPGEYQPTLPGMEKMLKGEQTSTSVFFNHPNAVDHESGDVPGSSWYVKSRNFHPEDAVVRTRSLRPVQDWVDDNYINSEAKPPPMGYHEEGKPLVERVGRKNVLHDGHHRVVRARLAGEKTIKVARWNEL